MVNHGLSGTMLANVCRQLNRNCQCLYTTPPPRLNETGLRNGSLRSTAESTTKREGIVPTTPVIHRTKLKVKTSVIDENTGAALMRTYRRSPETVARAFMAIPSLIVVMTG